MSPCLLGCTTILANDLARWWVVAIRTSLLGSWTDNRFDVKGKPKMCYALVDDLGGAALDL